jgi:hypothetical protein
MVILGGQPQISRTPAVRQNIVGLALTVGKSGGVDVFGTDGAVLRRVDMLPESFP